MLNTVRVLTYLSVKKTKLDGVGNMVIGLGTLTPKSNIFIIGKWVLLGVRGRLRKVSQVRNGHWIPYSWSIASVPANSDSLYEVAPLSPFDSRRLKPINIYTKPIKGYQLYVGTRLSLAWAIALWRMPNVLSAFFSRVRSNGNSSTRNENVIK